MELTTKSGYPLLTMASLYQKAIRRGDVRMAAFAAHELWERYSNYLWKRTLVISAEDCAGIITKEIWALFEADNKVNSEKKGKKTRIFIAKAMVLLLQAKKNRDADHLANAYMRDDAINESIINDILNFKKDEIVIPDYVYDVHTLQGKIKGKTKKQFFREEYDALVNRQPGLFDDLAYSMPV